MTFEEALDFWIREYEETRREWDNPQDKHGQKRFLGGDQMAALLFLLRCADQEWQRREMGGFIIAVTLKQLLEDLGIQSEEDLVIYPKTATQVMIEGQKAKSTGTPGHT